MSQSRFDSYLNSATPKIKCVSGFTGLGGWAELRNGEIRELETGEIHYADQPGNPENFTNPIQIVIDIASQQKTVENRHAHSA